MATAIRLARSSSYASLSQIQNDAELWRISQDLAPLFSSKPFAAVTAGDVVQRLESSGYSGVTQSPSAYRYMLVWDPVAEEWFVQCVLVVTISIPDPLQASDPRIVILEESARYAP